MELVEKAKELLPLVEDKIQEIKAKFGDDAIEVLRRTSLHWSYPVEQHPVKIVSTLIRTLRYLVLQGIKGQYLILDTGVINIRKFGSY